MTHKFVVHAKRSLTWLALAAALGILAPLQIRQPPASVRPVAVAALSSATNTPMVPADPCWGCGH